jgi:hypothetical protein
MLRKSRFYAFLCQVVFAGFLWADVGRRIYIYGGVAHLLWESETWMENVSHA